MSSKTNCQIGDLAIVISAEQSQNLGQIVEVVGRNKGKPFGLKGPGIVWQVRTVSGRETLYYLFRDLGKVVLLAEGPAPDCRLKPVTGLPDGDKARTEAGVGIASSCEPGRREVAEDRA